MPAGNAKTRKIRIMHSIKGICEILSIIWTADKKLAILFIANNLRNITWPLQALAVKGIIDTITIAVKSGLGSNVRVQIFFWFGLYFIPFTANRIWWPLNSYARALMLAKVSNEMKNRIMKAVSSARLEFFDRPESYNILKNAIDQTDGRRPIGVVNNIFSFFTTILSFTIVFIPMMKINAVLTAFLILSAIPGIILQNRFSKASYRFERDAAQQKRKIDYAYSLFTNKRTAKEVRQLDISGYIAGKHAHELAGYQKSYIALHNRKFALDIPVWAITQITALIGYYVIMAAVSKGNIKLGDLSFFISVVGQIQTAIQDIGNAYNGTAESGRFMNNIFELYDNPYIDPVGGAKPGKCSKIEIEFEGVSFKYPGSNEYALKNVSFKINLPEHIAVVGLNGSGKTTLVKLLLRLYDPQEGRILFNGVDLKHIDINDWRKLFTVCFQDVVNYGFSMRESISLSYPEANESEICKAAEKAGLSEVISGLPSGLDTCLSKEFDINSSELSGGQYNRVAIARAFLGKGKIVILDEPTAALDAKAEHEIFGLFDSLEKDKLGIMITHRLSSTISADNILVLEKGRLTEFGNHEELMRKGGTYAMLFNMQAKSYMEAVV